MSDPISFDPYLAWVDTTDPDNLPEDVRLISASDLLRYENFGVTAKNKINAESVRVDDVIVRLDDIDDLNTATSTSVTALNNAVTGLDASIISLDGRIDDLEAAVPGAPTGVATIIRKTSSTIRTATTTLADDPHLIFNLGPDQMIEVTAVLFVSGVVAADIKFAFTGAGITYGRWGSPDSSFTPGDNPNGISVAFNTTGSSQTFIVNGILQAGPSGGSVRLMWAQYVSDAGDTTLHRNSYLKMHTLSGG